MFFYIIYGNYNHKLLAGIRDKFKKLALKKGSKIAKKEKKKGN